MKLNGLRPCRVIFGLREKGARVGASFAVAAPPRKVQLFVKFRKLRATQRVSVTSIPSPATRTELAGFLSSRIVSVELARAKLSDNYCPRQACAKNGD